MRTPGPSAASHHATPGKVNRPATAWPGPVAVVLLGIVAPLLGCNEPAGNPGPALTRDQFIDVVVAIRRAELDLEGEGEEGDSLSAPFQVRRDSILAAHGTTREELYEFLERHTDLRYMDAVWDSITQGLKRPLRSRALPPEPDEEDTPRQGWPATRSDDDGRGASLRSGG